MVRSTYQLTSTGKFVGVTNEGGGGGGSGITTSNVRDEIQGYYGYTTDYYTVGVANTSQFVGDGETTMIIPRLRGVSIYVNHHDWCQYQSLRWNWSYHWYRTDRVLTSRIWFRCLLYRENKHLHLTLMKIIQTLIFS